MEFSSFSTVECDPAADGGVTPGLVPIPNIDPDELDEAVERLCAIGEAIEESGEGITSAWASLTGIYVAPEADTLLSVLDPVSSDGSTVATAVRDAADALTDFAEIARELKTRLSGLKAEAEAFRADVGWDKEWLEDEDERERNNGLNNRIATAVQEYEEAERDCANKIGEHYDGTWFTGYSDKASYDQTKTDGDRTYQLYGTMGARTDQPNPWGSPVDAPTSALEDALWGVGDIAIGAVVGLGLATGLYRDGEIAYPFGTEHGQNMVANWEDTRDSFWAVLGSDAQGEWADPGGMDAQWANSKAALIEIGDSIVPGSEWDDRPMYTIVNGTGNVALMITPMGWARTFFDSPGGGSAPTVNPDGSIPADRGPNGVSDSGSGVHGTDTVRMPATDYSAGHPDPGNPIGDMHESLGALQEQLNGAPNADPGTPTGSPSPEPTPVPEGPAPSATPSPESSSTPPSPDDIASPQNEGSVPRSGEGTPARGEGDAPGAEADPTTQDLLDGTPGGDADHSSDPWATSPVDDGSTTGQNSPTTPVTSPTVNSSNNGDNGSFAEDSSDDPAPAASGGGGDDGSDSGAPTAPSDGQGEDQGNGQDTPTTDPNEGWHAGEGTEDNNSASGTENSESTPQPPPSTPSLDPPASYPGHADGDGVRRFTTDDEGQAYGDRVLGHHFDSLSPEQQHAARSYTQKSYYYNTFSRMTDKDEAIAHLIDLDGDYFQDWLYEWFGGPESTHANADQIRAKIEDNLTMFDQAFSNPLPESIEMKRGMKEIDFMLDPSEGINDPTDLIGEDFTEKGFTSGSLGAEAAFNGPSIRYRLNIDIPEGYHALWMGKDSLYPTQREIILPRGAKLVFSDAIQDPDTQVWDITAEVEEIEN